MKSKQMIEMLNRDMPYVNKPVTDSTADEIGMNVYVDYLESAIENDVNMISVVSRFGTGKSSLIELLKSKYKGKYVVNGEEYDRVYCEINLWSQLDKAREHKEEGAEKDSRQGADTLELHRAFLYQLVSSINPDKSSFISRRTSRNFGMFKISTESRIWNFFVTIIACVFLFLMFLKGFSTQIVAMDIMKQATLDSIILGGTIICSVFFLLTLLKTEVLFSSKNSEGTRTIEENEIINLYHKHVLVRRNFLKRCKFFQKFRKHFVVIIEDLDRTENGDSVYRFLKELRKYYLPSQQIENAFFNKITFIVNIMPEDKLHERCEYVENDYYVYDKLFDYSLNLNRINVDNFDAILEALLQEKKEELQRIGINIQDRDNVHNIPGMQWIIREKSLSLRQVKERLNDSIILYESLIEKFDEQSVEFPKCAVVAYLRSAFSKWFYDLEDRELDEMVTWYAKNTGSKVEFVNAFSNGNYKRNEFLIELYKMIEARLIDGNYRTYFFNYPKSSVLYNVQETRVRNLIIYDDRLTTELTADIAVVAESKPSVIIEALRKEKELLSKLPYVVLFSPELWKLAEVHFEKDLMDLIEHHFVSVDELRTEEQNIIDHVIKMSGGPQRLSIAVSKSKLEIKVAVRRYIVEKYVEKASYFTDLFHEMLAPITEEELDSMGQVPLRYVLKMVNGTVQNLEGEVIDKICERVLEETEEEVLGEAMGFYTELIAEFGIASVVSDVVDYMIARKMVIPQFARVIFEKIKKSDLDRSHYFRMIYNVPSETMQLEQMEQLAYLDEPGNVSEALCKRMKSLGFLKEYMLHMLMSNPSRIDLTWDEVQDVISLHGEQIWSKHPDLFRQMRVWACNKYKDDMIQLEEYFKAPYPLLTNDEATCFVIPDSIFEIYDVDRVAKDKEDVFVNYCNRQYRNGIIAFKIFSFVSNMPKDVIETLFYKFDMKKVRFSNMKKENRSRIIEMLRVPLNLSTAKEILRFMNFTECLMPELESEIWSELKEDKSGVLCKAYIAVVNKYGKLTKETMKNIHAMPSLYAYGDLINEELYKKKQYRMYVCSKTMEKGEFVIEYDKLDILWNEYLKIFKDWETHKFTCPRMGANKEFLMMIQNKKAYKELPEKGWLAMASIPQDEDTLIAVLEHKDEFVVEYFSNINGFTSKVAAEGFVKIMRQYQKYAQNSRVYRNVHPKLGNGSLKGQYTKLYNEANR